MKTTKKKVLWLQAELMGYSVAVMNELVVNKDVNIICVHWDQKKLSDYVIEGLSNSIKLLRRSEISVGRLIDLLRENEITCIVVSGWQDRAYLMACLYARWCRIPVVSCFDDQWFGSARQKFAAFASYCGLLKVFYTHAWVSGSYQFEFARRLGFNKDKIIFDLLCGDSRVFFPVSGVEKEKLKRHFVFIGRLETVKGVEILIEAWSSIRENLDWELIIIGSGSLEHLFKNVSGVKLLGFMQPRDLGQILAQCHCFVLPSLNEPWGVVVHEAALSGLPLILSDEVGARTAFLIDHYNGFLVKSGSVESLKNAMKKFTYLSDQELSDFSLRSFNLSSRIAPETSAFNLLSIMETNSTMI